MGEFAPTHRRPRGIHVGDGQVGLDGDDGGQGGGGWFGWGAYCVNAAGGGVVEVAEGDGNADAVLGVGVEVAQVEFKLGGGDQVVGWGEDLEFPGAGIGVAGRCEYRLCVCSHKSFNSRFWENLKVITFSKFSDFALENKEKLTQF